MTVRAADADAIAPVMAVMTAAFEPCYGEAWTTVQTLGILAMPGANLHVAETQDGVIDGFAITRAAADECELMMIAVAPPARRRGIARDLIAAIAADQAARGTTALFLEMRDGNPAVALYEAVGFEQIGRRRAYYRGANGQSYDALTYRCTLPQ